MPQKVHAITNEAKHCHQRQKQIASVVPPSQTRFFMVLKQPLYAEAAPLSFGEGPGVRSTNASKIARYHKRSETFSSAPKTGCFGRSSLANTVLHAFETASWGEAAPLSSGEGPGVRSTNASKIARYHKRSEIFSSAPKAEFLGRSSLANTVLHAFETASLCRGSSPLLWRGVGGEVN